MKSQFKSDNKIDRDAALALLTSPFPDLKEQWERHKSSEYTDYQSERLDYVDIGVINRYIVDKFKVHQPKEFDDFFNRVEIILNQGDDYTKELMIIGLLEGIQNVSGWEDANYHDFEKWLKPETKKAWNELTRFWIDVEEWTRKNG